MDYKQHLSNQQKLSRNAQIKKDPRAQYEINKNSSEGDSSVSQSLKDGEKKEEII